VHVSAHDANASAPMSQRENTKVVVAANLTSIWPLINFRKAFGC